MGEQLDQDMNVMIGPFTRKIPYLSISFIYVHLSSCQLLTTQKPRKGEGHPSWLKTQCSGVARPCQSSLGVPDLIQGDRPDNACRIPIWLFFTRSSKSFLPVIWYEGSDVKPT